MKYKKVKSIGKSPKKTKEEAIILNGDNWVKKDDYLPSRGNASPIYYEDYYYTNWIMSFNNTYYNMCKRQIKIFKL